MNTTALLVDILIIGAQVLLWIAGFTLSFFMTPSVFMNIFSKSPTFFILVIIMISYTLGIIFDYLNAPFFSMFKSAEEKNVYSNKGLIISILHFDKDTHAYLDSQYARLRISKATIINIPLITFSACCFLINNNVPLKLNTCAAIFTILSFGIIFTILSIISYWKRNKVYWGYIQRTNQIIEEKSRS
jgi:hypothetical protein